MFEIKKSNHSFHYLTDLKNLRHGVSVPGVSKISGGARLFDALMFYLIYFLTKRSLNYSKD